MQNGEGKFSFEMLQKFWYSEKGFDPDTAKVALSFMESCEICFDLNRRGQVQSRNPIIPISSTFTKGKTTKCFSFLEVFKWGYPLL